MEMRTGYHQSQARRTVAGTELYFYYQYRHMISVYTPTGLCAEFEKRHGLRHLKLHGLRHTCASLLVAAGTDPETVRDVLGHDSVPPQRESIKDYHRITCEKGKYLAKQPPILRNEPTSSQKTMNQTVKTMHRIALVFAMESCMKNAWKSTQTQRMQSCFFAMV